MEEGNPEVRTRLSVYDLDYRHTAEGIPTWEWLLAEGWARDEDVVSVELEAEGMVRVQVLDKPLAIDDEDVAATHWVRWPVSTPPPFARPPLS